MGKKVSAILFLSMDEPERSTKTRHAVKERQEHYPTFAKNIQQMYGSLFVLFHFMPCFCTFFRSIPK